MEHQDWNPIIINKSSDNNNNACKKEKEKQNSKYVPPPETIKMEAPKNLGLLISQGRAAKNKTQKQLASELGISSTILSRWETNKEFPNNGQIATIEKTLALKLPRAKKTKVDEH